MRNLVKSIEVGNKTMKITIVIILNALLDLLLPRRVKILPPPVKLLFLLEQHLFPLSICEGHYTICSNIL